MKVLFLTGLAKLGCFLPLHLVMETDPVSKHLIWKGPRLWIVSNIKFIVVAPIIRNIYIFVSMEICSADVIGFKTSEYLRF